jgi:lipopolysaccharide export system permease protein
MLLMSYWGKSYFKSFASITLIMLIVSISFGLLTQVKYLGIYNYHLSESLLYIIYLIPRNLYKMAPFTLLLTALLLIQRFIISNELLASLCQGVSRWRLLSYLAGFSLIAIFFCMILGEWVAPSFERSAKELRARAVTGGNLIPGINSFWLKDGNQFIHATWSHRSEKLNDIEVYTFENEELSGIVKAKAGFYHNNYWTLKDVEDFKLYKNHLTKGFNAEWQWNFTMTPSVLSLARIKPDFLSMQVLYRLYSQPSHFVNPVYGHALFKRIFYPINIFLLSLIIFAILLKNSHNRVSLSQHAVLFCWSMFVFSFEYILQLVIIDTVTPLIWGLSSVVLLLEAIRSGYSLKYF